MAEKHRDPAGRFARKSSDNEPRDYSGSDGPRRRAYAQFAADSQDRLNHVLDCWPACPEDGYSVHDQYAYPSAFGHEVENANDLIALGYARGGDHG